MLKSMTPQPSSPPRWQADLTDFFAAVDREDETFGRNITRQGTFYDDTVRPALEAAAEVLRARGRLCEIGLDQSRLYLIVRQGAGPVEFQYAVFAEVRIEAVTPYVHCWFEEDKLAEKPAEKAADPGQEAGKDEPNKDDAPKGEGEGEGDEDPKKEEKDDKKPARTKTIELLGTWAEGRELESVTQEEIMTDFAAHYREAVTRLRAHLHTTPH